MLATLLMLTALLSPAIDAVPAKHPHFQRRVEIELPRKGAPALVVKATHLTATFDRKGFEAMKPGGAWHLANCHLELSADVEIGGKKVAAGKYRLLARKTEAGPWDLVLDDPAPFSAKMGDKVVALESRYAEKMPLHDHLHVDVLPAGDKTHTIVNLEVSFDTYRLTAAVKVP